MTSTTKKVRKVQLAYKSADINRIDYKNIAGFNRYVSSYGKIVPRYYTKISLKAQKDLSTAVKYARYMALIPYVK